MKTTTIRMLSKSLTALCFVLLSFAGYSQTAGTAVLMELKNVTQPTASTLEYEVWVTNSGTTSLALRGYSCGVNAINLPAGVLGTLSMTYLGRDASLSTLPNPTVATPAQIAATPGHLRLTTVTAVAGNEVVLASLVPVRVATVRVTTALPGGFASLGTNFNWLSTTNPLQVTTQAGRTQCIATCYVGAAGTNYSCFGTANPSTATSINVLTGSVVAPAASLNPLNCLPTAGASSETACDTYTWAGGTHTSSGTYVHTFVNGNSCGADSVHTLTLTINNSTTSTESATACDSYVWACDGLTYNASGTYTCTSLNTAGCVNTATLNLTINASTTSTETASSCTGSYVWACDGLTYNASGTYTCTSLNAAGCVNTATLNLTIGNATTSTETATACDSYVWACNGQTYNASGAYTCTSLNAAGCVNTATLDLTINASSTSTETATACDSYVWACNGQTYNASGMYTCTSTNAAGCVNTATLDLTINASSTSTETATACDSYVWACNGQTYNASGMYTCTSTNAAGCVNTATLDLTINNSVTNTSTISANGSYSWSVSGLTYTASGTYTFTSLTGAGCLNTEVLQLTIVPITTCNFNLQVDEDQPISCFGNDDASLQASVLPAGSYTFTIVSPSASTSSNVTGYFNMLEPGTHTVYATDGSSTCSQTITYIEPDPLDMTFSTDSMVSCLGNDGMLSINITGGTSILQGYLTWWTNANGDTLNLVDNFALFVSSLPAGNYNVAIEDDHGCFYNETGAVQVAPAVVASAASGSILCNGGSTTITPSGNGGVSYPPAFASTLSYTINGLAVASSYTAGSYTVTATDLKGCTGTTVIVLSEPALVTGTSSATACDSYTWNTITYTTSGSYTGVFLAANGCDSVHTLNLTINNSSTSTETASACDSYVWACNGQTYNASGAYTCTSLNAAGCVNTATLNLTINASSTSTETATACDSYVWACNGQTYNASGMYTCTSLNAAGCVNTATLDLTINTATTSTETATACDSYVWACNGQTYNASGMYTCTSLNAAGCVNTATLDLTINTATTSTETATACDSYVWACNGQTYNASGMYTCTSLNAAGCVNTATLDLTINASSTSTETATACDSYVWACNGQTYNASGMYTCTSLNAAGCVNTATLNLTINNSSSTSTSATATGSYVWACDGATYTASGVYTCTSLNANGCVNTETLTLTIDPIVVTCGTCPGFTLSVIEDQPISCNGNLDASLQATASPAGTYTYSIVSPSGSSPNNTTGYFDQLVPGTHTVYATDGTCTTCQTIFFLNPDPLDITFVTDSMVSCLGNDGQLSVIITGGTNVLQGYLTWWTNAAGDTLNDVLLDNFATTMPNPNSPLSTTLPAGNYNVAIEDDRGCFYNETGAIDVAPPIVVTAPYTPITCAGGTTVISPSGTGGVSYPAAYASTLVFTINGAPVAASYPAGTYTVTATDYKNCSNSIVVTIANPSPLTGSSSITACDSYTWNGNTYTTSGTYIGTFATAGGCDSIHTLNLTINYSTSSTTSYYWCDMYTWPVSGQTYTASGTYAHTTLNAAGCVNTQYLNLTLGATTVSITCCVEACGSYTWAQNGITYTASGSYYWIGQNASGCPDVHTLCLTINQPTASSFTASACNSYTWACNGNTYTSSGMYTCTSLNAAGCLHTTTLDLTINTGVTNTTTLTACDSYTWSMNNMTYTLSGMYTYTMASSNGCVNTEILDLTINNSTSNTTTATACDSYTWTLNNMTYTMGGTYVATSLNAAGCTHTETLNLTVNYSTADGNATVTACDSYTWNGSTYTTSGSYTYTSLNASGCVNTATLTLTVNYSTADGNATVTACDSYTWNGSTYTTSGSYTYTSLNASGCVNTATLTLTVNYSTADGNATVTVCDSYTWNGSTYTTSGSYTYTSLNASGCVNTATLTLTVNYSTADGNATVTACDSYTWNGSTYTTSGSYTYTSLNASGCVNTATLTLTVNYSTADGNATVTACDSYTWNGSTYTTSGSYTYTSLNASGCVNTATLTLTVNYSTADGNATVTACDSYTWNGSTYTTSGSYTYTSLNASGCVNTATLTLTVNYSTADGNSTVTACDSYTWNGSTYTLSGSYTYTSLNASGCVNTATLTLTVNYSTADGNATVTACDSYTWNGSMYTTSGTYTYTSLNASGCLNTATLTLTINSSTTSSTTTTQCDAYTWNGATYTTAGTYTYTSLNAAGCLNTDTLHLTINYGSSDTVDVTACNSYTWTNGVTYTMAGQYSYTYNNSFGCASMHTLNLTMNNGVVIAANAMLRGAYDASTGLMKDSLRRVTLMQAPGSLPSDGQFVVGAPVNVIVATRLPFALELPCPNDNDATMGGGNAATIAAMMAVSGPDAIVDWVLIEVRDGSNYNTVVSTKNALIQRDGDVVSSLDGVSPLIFSCVCPGNYYVSIKHRNHLGVMTANTVTLTAASTFVPFSAAATPVWVNGSITNTPRSAAIGSVATLWGGDANTNKNAKYNGLSNDKEVILTDIGGPGNSNVILYQTYKKSDLNMDGRVKYNNFDNDKNWLLQLITSSTVGATPNDIISQHTPN